MIKPYKRKLIFNPKNTVFCHLIKPLIKYFEDFNIEDLQINEFEKITLIKRDGTKESIINHEVNERFIKNLMFYVSGLANQNYVYGDTQVTHMLPINKFRFTGRVDKTINSGVKISIRLNDNELYHTYQDFNLTELEFNFLIKHICTNRRSCFFIGGPSSGKTTFTNLLINKIDSNEIINVVGDINELIFREDQHVSEITAKTKEDYQSSFDLLTRSNPDRIIVPELTIINSNPVLRTINSGIKGFMVTLHADSKDKSVAEAFSDNLKLAKEDAVSVVDLDKKITKFIDFFIHLGKNKQGKRGIEKIVINNKIIEKEAKALGILGFTQKHSPQYQKKKEFSLKIIQQLTHDYIKNKKSLRQLEVKYGISYITIYRWFKKIGIKKTS